MELENRGLINSLLKSDALPIRYITGEPIPPAETTLSDQASADSPTLL
jgi:hypothetical protein